MKRAMRETLTQKYDYPWRIPSDNKKLIINR